MASKPKLVDYGEAHRESWVCARNTGRAINDENAVLLSLQNIANRSVIMKVAQILLALVGGPPTTAHDSELFVLLI